MRNTFVSICVVLLLLLSGGTYALEVNPWEQLAWIDVQGAVPAGAGYNFKAGNISELGLDVIGDFGKYPGRYGIDEEFAYFELRVDDAITAGRWTAVFFPEGVEDPNPQSHYLLANLMVGLEKRSNGSTRVFIVGKQTPGQKIIGEPEYFEDEEYFNLLEDQGDYLVRWKIPLDKLKEYCGAIPVAFTLGTGNLNSFVPNLDAFGWDILYLGAADPEPNPEPDPDPEPDPEPESDPEPDLEPNPEPENPEDSEEPKHPEVQKVPQDTPEELDTLPQTGGSMIWFVSLGLVLLAMGLALRRMF